MATAREIRRRIRSVRNIAKVTGALEAVSASKVRRAQQQALASRAYARAAFEILQDVALHHEGGFTHPLLDQRPVVNRIGVVLITSDRGLAGPYNTNMVRVAIDFEKKQTVPVAYIAVGRKGRDLMLRRGSTIIADFSHLPGTPSILDIAPLSRTVMDDFLNGTIDEVYIAYTNFVNMLRQEPVVQRLLPLQPHRAETTARMGESTREGPRAVYLFEPDPQSILEEILPRFTELIIYQCLLESLASEHSARMVAMRNATENAHALVEDLTLSYNKARQLAITNEILDIVGGAEALAQAETE